MKVVINRCFGGFSISQKGIELYNKITGKNQTSQYRFERTDPDLIRVIEQLGDEADGSCARLDIVDIPDGINWEIDDYDGKESIHEVHRSWA